MADQSGQVLPSMVAKPAGFCIIGNMMKRKTYTAEYHDKTDDFRVVRWAPALNGCYIGTSIDRFNTEQEAMEVAAILNQGEELDLYQNQSCEFDT
jgi:hypothetical protein